MPTQGEPAQIHKFETSITKSQQKITKSQGTGASASAYSRQNIQQYWACLRPGQQTGEKIFSSTASGKFEETWPKLTSILSTADVGAVPGSHSGTTQEIRPGGEVVRRKRLVLVPNTIPTPVQWPPHSPPPTTTYNLTSKHSKHLYWSIESLPRLKRKKWGKRDN